MSTAKSIRACARCDAGATAIEYSMVAGMIALLIIAATTLIGADVQAMLQDLADSW